MTGGLSGNAAKEAFCLKSAPESVCYKKMMTVNVLGMDG